VEWVGETNGFLVGGGGKKLMVDFKDVMFFKIKDLQKKRKNGFKNKT
jgi:hypothetical protein